LETLGGDTAAADRALDGLGGDVVVCGWSYGGNVVTGLEPTQVRHVVYIASAVPDRDESLSAITNERPAEGFDSLFEFDDAGNLRLVGDVDTFVWPDAPADVAAVARKSLRPQALQTFLDVPTRVLWREVPSTYVICRQDRVVNPELQRQRSRRATHAIEWDTSHSAMLSRPELAIELLDNLAR
jgi:pimeloyl-ACP methyl ester carboxylesterase